MNSKTPDWIAAEIGDPNTFFLGLMKETVPEKATALQEVVDKHSITFRTNEREESCYFTVDYDTCDITIGLRGAARLMAHSFSYTCAHYGLLQKLVTVHGLD